MGGPGDKPEKVASLDDICESMKQQLMIFVEWAKYLPMFKNLDLEDQVPLIFAFFLLRCVFPAR